MVRIAAPVLEAILARAAASPHAEVCGLLFGTADAIEGVDHAANVAASPHDMFEIDPRALFAALRAERAGGPRLIGHYHSHPNGSAVPSRRDLAAAEPGPLWLIVGGGAARAWRLAGPRFAEVPLTRLPCPAAAATSAPSPASGASPAMTDASVDFASLLCSRLCHDLLSPVGALGNGLELLADETEEAQRARCLELIADSQRAAADKLSFFRLAFGAGGGFGDDIPSGDLRQALEGLTRGKAPVELGWLIEGPAVARGPAKILLNLALIASDALVRGGRMDVGAEGGEVVVRAEGPRLVLDGGIRAVLAGDAGEPTSRTAPAWLARRLTEEAGGTLQLADGEAGVLVLAAAVAR